MPSIWGEAMEDDVPKSATDNEYDFVEKPSEEFFCPVTFDLLREPHQMLCCGNHLSQQAVTRLQGQPCPVCKEANLNTVPDKFFKRKVDELKVRCPNKSLGCEWVGELGSLDRHLSQNSVRLRGTRQMIVPTAHSPASTVTTKLPTSQSPMSTGLSASNTPWSAQTNVERMRSSGSTSQNIWKKPAPCK